jgi:hypothetical protein
MWKRADLLASACGLSAIHADIVHKRTHHTICVDGDVKRFVYQEVVPRTLADNAEIIDERLLDAHLGVELVLCDPRTLVLVTGRLPKTTDALWLKVRCRMDASGVVNRETEQNVKITTQDN